MAIQENKTKPRQSTAMSGSLAYYNLLAGINVARSAVHKQRLTSEVALASQKSHSSEFAKN